MNAATVISLYARIAQLEIAFHVKARQLTANKQLEASRAYHDCANKLSLLLDEFKKP